MEFLAISAAALAFTLVLAVLNAPLRAEKAKERRVRAVAQSGAAGFDELEGNVFERMLGPILKRLRQASAARRAKRTGKTGKKSPAAEKLERRLRSAGVYMDPATFTVVKLILMIALMLGAMLLTSKAAIEAGIKLLIMLGAGIIALLLPDYTVRFIAGTRQDSMKKQLPDMMDLLSVSIDAGLGFDAALKRALDKFTGALKEEMTIASMEIAMGKPRRDALSDMAERCDIAELKILTAAIVQSEQMGTPIKNVLKTQSAQLRANRKQAAQEKGMKAPVKMMLPMVAFIFPVLLIILMGPTIMNIVEIFK
jgi:tight adherence protein C